LYVAAGGEIDQPGDWWSLVDITLPDGTTRRVVNVKGRGAVNRELQPTAQIVQATDSKGNVRQILIPSR